MSMYNSLRNVSVVGGLVAALAGCGNDPPENGLTCSPGGHCVQTIVCEVNRDRLPNGHLGRPYGFTERPHLDVDPTYQGQMHAETNHSFALMLVVDADAALKGEYTCRITGQDPNRIVRP